MPKLQSPRLGASAGSGRGKTVLPGCPQTPACASLTLRSSRSPEAAARAVPSLATELCRQRLKPEVPGARRVEPAPPRPSPPLPAPRPTLANGPPHLPPLCPAPPRLLPAPHLSQANDIAPSVSPRPPHTGKGGLRAVPEGRRGRFRELDGRDHEGTPRRLEEAAQTLPGGFGCGWSPGLLGFQQRPLRGRRNY